MASSPTVPSKPRPRQPVACSPLTTKKATRGANDEARFTSALRISASCLLAFDYEESDTRRKRRSAIYECLENFSLRLLLVYLGNSCLHDGHVAGGLGARRLGGCQFYATFVSSVQVFVDGSDEAAFGLHICLPVKKSRKRLVE